MAKEVDTFKTLDESLTFRPDNRLTTRQKIVLSFACLPTNVGWALSESLIIPYLLIIGAPLYVCSWTWFFSPLLASYVAPRIDELSDNWTTQNCWGWRGRKQLIMVISIISAITMVLLPQCHTITFAIFRTESVPITFMLAMIIFTIMDISFYLLLRPIQALIWDITIGNKEMYMDTMKIFNVVQGVCRMSGLIIAAICISFDFVIFDTHIGSAFTLAAIIIIICSFFSLFYSPNPPELDSLSDINTMPFANTGGFTSNLFTNIDEFEMHPDEMKHLLANDKGHVYSIDEYDTDEDDMNMLNTAELHHGEHTALRILWLSQLSGWCSMCSVVLFWTSFISIDVYQGVAIYKDKEESFEWMQFKAGLVFGAYGLLLTSLVSVNCSVLYPWLRKRISTRSLYLFGEIGMALLCVIFCTTVNETWLLLLISAFGLFTQIHMQSCLELTENELQPMFNKMRGSKMMELANVIAPVAVSLFSGPMVYAFNGQFKYLFLLAGSIQLVFDLLVLLMFCNIFPWRLPYQ
eukprot:181305_1